MNMFARIINRFDLPLFMLMMVGLALSACEMKAPSQLGTNRIQVVQENSTNMMGTSAFTDATARMVADDYAVRGHGPVDVVVTYAAGASEGRATMESRRISGLLQKHGVQDLTVSTLPVNTPEQAGQVMVNYIKVTAKAPAGCGNHPAESRADIRANEDGRYPNYNFGCGVDSYIAQQIARPKDLLGKDEMSPADGKRMGGVLQDYRDGKDYKDLKADNASQEKL